MVRKLASIQAISSIEPIPNADAIDKATILGWSVVVKKGEFNVGDACIFCEIDSILPDGAEWAEFMRPRKFRIKTAKLRGVLSQGIAFPLSILPGAEDMEIGTDVSEQLKIKKYEPNLHYGGAKMGSASGSFPVGVPKTDETRIQSALGVIDEIRVAPFYMTVKCDGTSGTFLYDDEFCACSRNWKKREDKTNIYWDVARKYGLPEKLKHYPYFAVQGEIVGPGIQRNRLMLTEPDLLCFDIFDVKAGKYLDYYDLAKMCADLGLKTVPLENIIEDLGNFDFSLEAWLKRAEGKYIGTKNHREGIVIRPMVNIYSPTLKGRLSFKVINNKYLLSGGC